MTSKDALDLSTKFADFSFKALQFFVIVSLALAGWIMATISTGSIETTFFHRSAWIVFYLANAFMYWIVHRWIRERVEASFALAMDLADQSLAANPNFQALTRLPSSKYQIAFWAIVLLVSLIIGFI